MSQTNFSAAERDSARAAGDRYRHALGLAFEDVRLGLKYNLLRLSVLGLSRQDQKEVRELARLVFADAEIEQAVDRIKKRKTASPLAVALAEVVAAAPDKKAALLGAIFGAYAGLSELKITDGILGAVAGAVALSTNNFVQQHLGLKRFLEAE